MTGADALAAFRAAGDFWSAAGHPADSYSTRVRIIDEDHVVVSVLPGDEARFIAEPTAATGLVMARTPAGWEFERIATGLHRGLSSDVDITDLVVGPDGRTL